MDCNRTISRSLRFTEIEEMRLFEGLDLLLGRLSTAWKVWYIDESHQCDLQTTTPYGPDCTQIFSWSLQPISKLVMSFARKAALLTCMCEKHQHFDFEGVDEIGIETFKTLHHHLLSPLVLLVNMNQTVYA